MTKSKSPITKRRARESSKGNVRGGSKAAKGQLPEDDLPQDLDEAKPEPLFPDATVEITPDLGMIKLTIRNAGGQFSGKYDSKLAFDTIIDFAKDITCPPVTVVDELMEIKGHTRTQARDELGEDYKRSLEVLVGTACNHIVENLEAAFESALLELLDEATNRAMVTLHGESPWIYPVKGLLIRPVKRFRQKWRRLLKLTTRGGDRKTAGKYNEDTCKSLYHHHKRLHSLWQKVTKAYGKDPSNWREELKRMDPTISDAEIEGMPLELINRLGVRDKYEKQPSVLALLHAAQLSGLEEKYSVRRLQDIRRKGLLLTKGYNLLRVKVRL
jgi:hypothetical protein